MLKVEVVSNQSFVLFEIFVDHFKDFWEFNHLCPAVKILT